MHRDLVQIVQIQCDGKEVMVWMTIGGENYCSVFLYAHGSDSAYREKQITWLGKSLERVPHSTRLTVAGDWNLVLDTARDIANVAHEYGGAHNRGVIMGCRATDHASTSEYARTRICSRDPSPVVFDR